MASMGGVCRAAKGDEPLTTKASSCELAFVGRGDWNCSAGQRSEATPPATPCSRSTWSTPIKTATYNDSANFQPNRVRPISVYFGLFRPALCQKCDTWFLGGVHGQFQMGSVVPRKNHCKASSLPDMSWALSRGKQGGQLQHQRPPLQRCEHPAQS
jgi:hypothetical protein